MFNDYKPIAIKLDVDVVMINNKCTDFLHKLNFIQSTKLDVVIEKQSSFEDVLLENMDRVKQESRYIELDFGSEDN